MKKNNKLETNKEKKDKILLNFIGIILIFISLYFILKLFFFGLDISSAGGFLRIGYTFSFDWTWASTISLLLLCFWIYIVLFYHEKNRIFAILFIFILSLLGKQIFYLVDRDFNFFYNTKTVSYMDENRVLTDFDEFVRLYDKHCEYEEGWSFKNNSRAGLCGGSDKYPKDFGTIDDYIKALDYFNKTNNENLYSGAYNLSIKKFGLETMIEEYRDDTFYGRVIYLGSISDNIIDKLYLNINNKKIVSILDNYIYLKNNNGLLDQRGIYEYRVNTLEKMSEIEKINLEIF